MANGQTNQNTPFFNPDPISQQDYLSGPVDFYSQSLGQSTGIQVTDPDDDKDKEKEEDTAPNIFAPIGADQDDRQDMSSLAMGLEDPGDFKSFGVADVADSIKATPYTDAGLFSEQTGDLVQSFGKDFSSNLDYIKNEVTSVENLFDISLRDFATGVQKEKPFGKGLSQMTAPPAVMVAMGPMGTAFAGLAAIGGAANHAIQKQNAAIFKATGAGFIGEFKGAMVSRKPGSLIYSGTFDSKEAMAAREAIEKGFIPGTLEAEKWDGKKWGQATGQKPMLLQDGKDMRAAGGTYDPETGNFITLDGKGAALGTMDAAQAMANKVDALLGTTKLMAAEDVNTIRSQVDSNIFGKVTGKNFEQRYRDEVVSRAQTATGLSSSQINDILDGNDFVVTGSFGTPGLTSKGYSTFSSFRGTSEEATGNPLDDYFSPEPRAKRAADAKAEQDRRDAVAREEAARQRMEDAIARGRREGREDARPGDDDFDARTGAEAVRDAGGPDRTRGGMDSFYSEGGRVGMQAGGETGFAQRPEFVGGNETPTDGQSIADDKPREVPEGTFVINAAAVDFAGREDIEKMVREAYAKAGDLGQTGVSQEVDIAVSEGEVIIPPHIAKIIGYDRLNKINNRGKKEISRRQAEREKKEAAGGGFISRKKFAKGDMVLPKSKPKKVNQAALADLELRADMEEFIQTDPLARLGWNLYEKGDLDIKAVVLPTAEKISVGIAGVYTPKDDRRDPGYVSRIFEDDAEKQGITKQNRKVAGIHYFAGENVNYGRYDATVTLLHELRHHAMRHISKKYKAPLPQIFQEEHLFDAQDYFNRIQARKVKPSIPKTSKEPELESRQEAAYKYSSANKQIAMYQEIAEQVLKDRKVPPRTKSKEVEGFFTRGMKLLGL